MALFDDGPRVVLDDAARRCRVTYTPDLLTPAEADALYDALRRDTPFAPETVRVHGRQYITRRQSASYGDPGTTYRYSGVLRAAMPWHPALVPLVATLRAREGVAYNFVLCNLYSDGAAGLGWHADDERDLVRDASIASVSLGVTRDFALRLGNAGPAVATLPLAHGSLLVMGGETQRHYQHRVPERARVAGARINLTFRVIAGR